jgi:hypothetical protein
LSRGRSVSVSAPDEEDDGEVKGLARKDKDKMLFECEKCSKVSYHPSPIFEDLSRLSVPPLSRNFFFLSASALFLP